jgi:hypothetical protein
MKPIDVAATLHNRGSKRNRYTSQDLTSNLSYLNRRCVLFYTNGHNPNPFLSCVNQLFAEDFTILF